MKLYTMHFAKVTVVLICIFFTSLSSLADENDTPSSFTCADAVNVMDCIEKTQENSSTSLPTPTESISLNTKSWGLSGPLGFGVRYDSQLKWISELNYVQMFFNSGMALQLGYGANERRANITLGYAFNLRQQIKFTYEYLSQNLPFSFASGDINEWVSQNAFGGAYRYLINHPHLHSFDLTASYIKANSKNLSDKIFYDHDNNAKLNNRRLAGGTEENVLANVTFLPWQRGIITTGIGYSHIKYDTQYEKDQNSSTFAYNLQLEQLLSSYTKLTTGIVRTAAQMEEKIKLSQIFPAEIEAAVTGEYSQGDVRTT